MTVIAAMWLINCSFSLLREFFLFAWTTAASVMEELEWPVYCTVSTQMSQLSARMSTYVPFIFRMSTQMSINYSYVYRNVSIICMNIYTNVSFMCSDIYTNVSVVCTNER